MQAGKQPPSVFFQAPGGGAGGRGGGRAEKLKVSLCVALTDVSGRGRFRVIHRVPKLTRTEELAQILWLKINLCSPTFLLTFCKCTKALPPTVRKVHFHL